MLKRKLGLAVAAILCVGLMTSCVINDNRSNGNGTNIINGIDYTDYLGGNFSIKVRNESKKNVVCFMGTPRESNLISGALATSTTGLKLNTNLFSNSKDFVLFVVTEEDYIANKSDLTKLDNTPFAQIYAYYNKDSVEANTNMVYTISSYMGGDFSITLNNPTKYNVEMRQNGLYGESLAFAGARTTQTTIAMQRGHYEIFPVFRRFNSKAGEIVTSFPQFTENGEDYPVYFTFDLDDDTDSQEFNANNWLNGVDFSAQETPSAAYVAIYNGNRQTSVSLYPGANAPAAKTPSGGKSINGGKTLTFEIQMTSTGKYTYSSTAKIDGWRIGTSMKDIDIEPIDVIYAGKIYYLDIGGTNYANLTAEWRRDSAGNLIVDTVNFDENDGFVK